MPQRHVKEIEAMGLARDSPSRGLLGIEPGKVEGIKLLRRFPWTALPEIRFGAKFRVNQLQFAHGRMLGRHGRGDRYQGCGNQAKQSLPGIPEQQQSRDQAQERQSGKLVDLRERRAESNRREPPSRQLYLIPDSQEMVECEERAEGRHRMVIQCLREGKQVGSQRRGDQAEEPGPVVARVSVEDSGVEYQEETERQDVQQPKNRLEIVDVG